MELLKFRVDLEDRRAECKTTIMTMEPQHPRNKTKKTIEANHLLMHYLIHRMLLNSQDRDERPRLPDEDRR